MESEQSPFVSDDQSASAVSAVCDPLSQTADTAEEEVDDPYDPSKPLFHCDVEYCDTCGVPTCYCRLFGHIRACTKVVRKLVTLHVLQDDGTELIEEEEVEEEEEEAEVVSTTVRRSNEQQRNVIITVKARTKRKNTTTIANLECWKIDVRDFSKEISKKMAIGCSYKKTQAGVQVVIQGDVMQAVINILLSTYSIPKTSIETVRKTKKNPTAINRHQPPPQPMLAAIEELTKQSAPPPKPSNSKASQQSGKRKPKQQNSRK